MISIKTIGQCSAKVSANGVLLMLTFAACQLCVRSSVATPIVTVANHITHRLGPHSLPILPVLPDGDKVQIFVEIDSSDPIGSPAISVEASQSGTTLTLDPIPSGNPLFEGVNGYFKFIDFDPGLMGAWSVVATDSTGVGPVTFTNAIPEPEFLPLVENITLQGTPIGASLFWTLPNLTGFDVDAISVRLFEATTGSQLWDSGLLPAQATSFQPPAGVLEAGVDYVYWVALLDLEGGAFAYLENVSTTFSEPFFFTVPGDFNLDGTVDAADYVVWRKTDGTQAGYDAWRTHFGASLGTGSGSSLPSAAPLSAAVPEPASLVLLLLVPLGRLVVCRQFTQPPS